MVRLTIALVGSIACGLCATARAAQSVETTLNFNLEQIVPRSQWWLRTWVDRGASAWDGTTLTLDYTRGAQAVVLGFADRSLSGAIKKIRIVVEGSAPGHPVSLHLRTHFMTFSKTLGEFGGSGPQILETDGPPGPGWTWSGGENDGKIHRPIRVGELRFAAGASKDKAELKISSFEILGASPPDRQVYLTARCEGTSLPVRFTAELRACADKPIRGRLSWTVRKWDGEALTEGRCPSADPAGRRLRVVLEGRGAGVSGHGVTGIHN